MRWPHGAKQKKFSMRRIPFTNWALDRIQNITKEKQPQSLRENVIQRSIQRDKKTVQKWRSALRRAENVYNPVRKDLNDIYREVVLDPHLDSVLTTRKLQVLEKSYRIVDNNGEVMEDATRVLQSKWFRDFMELAFKSIPWGYVLIEFGDIVDNEFQGVFEVPRDVVFPERRTFSLMGAVGQDERSVDEDEIYSDWLLFIDTGDLGLLNKATPWVLWKKIGSAAWAEYADVYGLPPAIGSTDINDQNAKANMEAMLSNVRDTDYIVKNHGDEVQPMDITQAGGTEPHKGLVEAANKELSKLVLGQTMTTEDGSSYSQAREHGRILETYEMADLQFFKDIVNFQLIPMMKKHGMIAEGGNFEYDLATELSLDKKWEVVKGLIQSGQYTVPSEWLKETFGVEVEGFSAAPSEPSNITSLDILKSSIREVDNFYGLQTE